MTSEKSFVRITLLFLLLLGSGLTSFAQLQANFTATPTSGCAPIRVLFTDISTGGATSWSWDLGNNTTSTLQNPSGTYFNPGTYSVTLTIYKGADSSKVVKTSFITVHPNPEPLFDANIKTGCFPLNVCFTDMSNPGAGNTITAWQWDFGDGNISNLQTPCHTYINAGLFNISLTVTNNSGCTKTLTKPNLIKVNDGLIADFTNTEPVACVVPASVTFTNTSVGVNITNYFWNFGDGNTSTLANPVHTYNQSGNFPITLTITNGFGCTNTIVKSNIITVGIVKANFNRPDEVCVGRSFNFQNVSVPFAALTSCHWDFGDGTTDTSTNPVKSYATPGVYTIKLVSEFGLCKDSVIKNITVLQKPVGDFTGTNLYACIAPLTASFTNTTVNGTIVRWYFGDGDTSSQTNPSHTYTKPGSFTVTLIVKNASGCTDTVKKPGFVVIAPPKIVSIDPLDVQACVPYTVNFTPTIQSVNPIVSYEWDLGNGVFSNLPNPVRTYTIEGTYVIKLKITTANGCTDSIVYNKGVKVGLKPTAMFTATPRNACAMDLIKFTDTSANAPDHWFWDFGDGGTSIQQNPNYNYNDTGFFTVKFIAIRSGCADTIIKQKYIYIRPPVAGFLDSVDCSDQKLHYFKDRSVGALFWTYWFGDGDTSNLPSPIHLYADTGRYVVRQEVRDSFCRHEATKTIMVLNEKAGFKLADSIGCKSTVKSFFADSTWNIKNYYWDFGDGSNKLDSGIARINHRYDSTGIYNVMLRITDFNNCPDSIYKPVSVSEFGPKADIGPFQKVCINSLVWFADSSKSDNIHDIVQWIWDFGDSTAIKTFSAPPFTHTYNKPGLFDIKLVVVDATGCSDTIVKPANVNVIKFVAEVKTSDTIKCKNTPIQFLATAYDAIDFQWDFGDGATGTGPNPVHTYTQENVYTIKLIAKNSIGCTDTVIKPGYIKIFDANARFAMSDSFTSCPPLFVSFTNQSINALSVVWDFGDGNTSTLLNPSHTYTFSGVFNVKLYVTGNGGCKDTITKHIKILGPSGTFVYNPILGCTPLQVSFVSTAQNTYFYTWDYNDGVTDFGQDPSTTHTYVRLGTFLPKIILEDSLGCKLPVLGIDSIKVKGIRSFIKGLPKYTLCDSASVSFFDSTRTNDIIQSYFWDFGDGFTSTQHNPTHRYGNTGIYTVTFQATTVTGCVSRDTLKTPIKIVAGPLVDLVGANSGCVPTTVTFNAVLLNPDTSVVRYSWNFGNNQTSNLKSPPSQVYSVPGTYNISLIGTNSSGCADTNYQAVTAFPLPIVDAGPGKYICLGQSYSLNASGAFSYSWLAQPSLSCLNCYNPLAAPNINTLYRVEGTDTNGCKAIDTVLVKVKQPFVMKVNPGDTICVGRSIRLGAFGAERYLWSPATYLDNTIISNPVSKPDSSITYRIVGYDTLNCFFDTGYVHLQVYPIPKVDILETKINLIVGNSVQLHSVSSKDVIRWRWTPPAGLSCADCPNPVATPKNDVTYTLQVSNAGSCLAEDRVTIHVLCNTDNLFVPNTFSPNKDGANDVFYPRGRGIYGIRSMRIYNRWGELMYEKMNFQANDVSAGWNGTFKNVELTPDVYVYTIEVICDNNQLFSLKGNVTLLK